MDRERAKFLVDIFEVLKAYAEGKTIQYRHSGCNWTDTNQPSFLINFEYRVKQEVTVSFRRYLWKDSNGRIRLDIWEDLEDLNNYNAVTKHAVETRLGFVKWVDNEIQTDTFYL